MKGTQIKELRDLISHKDSSSEEIKRAQAILMVDKEVDIEAIPEITNFRRSQIFGLRKKYFKKGLSSIEDPARKNPKELLTKKQREEIISILKNKNPKDFSYNANYWTTSIAGDLIWRRCKIKYKSKNSIYLIFKQAKFTYHKPDRLYQARNGQEADQWKKDAEIKANTALQEKDTIVLTADEMSLSAQTTVQKVWLPQGEYPKIEVAAKRDARSIYGFLNIRAGQETAFKAKRQNMYSGNILKHTYFVIPRLTRNPELRASNLYLQRLN